MSAKEDRHENENSDGNDENAEENEDPTVCDICLDGEVYENNEILFCDSCDVAVHQLCYGVKKIPEDSWFCYVCTKGLKPSEITCELCSYKGGAYKPIEKKNKWTHGLCAVWIPELYEQHSQTEPPTWQFQHLDKRRYNLKCALCKTKGACVQCCYGRCTTAVHPWCALRTPQGFTRRIIKDDEGEPHWEIFCKAHAKAVSDPVKKSSKNKNQSHSSAALFEENDIYWEDPDAAAPVHPQGRRQSAVAEAANTAQQAKAPVISLNLVEDVGDTAYIPLKEDDDDAQNDSDDDEKPSGLAGALQEQSATSFPTLSLLEWPGLSEGDGMDLDHFWNFTSSFFAEDHTREWFKFMKNGASQALPRQEDGASVLQLSTALRSASKEDLEDVLEEVNEAFSTERNRSTALYYDKRNRFLDDVERTLELLAACASDNTNLLSSLAAEQRRADTEGETKESSNQDPIAAAKSKLFAYYQHKRFSFDDEHAFLPEEAQSKAQFQPAMKEQLGKELKVVFDGSTRLGATFSLVDDDNSSTVESSSEDLCTAKQYIYPALEAKSKENDESELQSLQKTLRLESFEAIPYDKKLVVQGKSVLAKDDISILQRLILTDFHAYIELIHSMRNRLDHAIQVAEESSAAGHEVDLYETSKDVHMAYVKQQVWKWVCSSMNNGVCDQKPGAYKAEEVALPASWTIQVPGRPAAPSKEEEEKESHEDIVCMCCFDGTFAEDRNQILFCDGCNATMHQKCYGIAEIPEGHFYCDRCTFIQRQYHDEDVDETFLKNAVRCSLCPLYHGGLKRTTDKRWVHMCCALFTGGNTTIHNLTKMTHIDISHVPVQNQGRPMVIPKANSSSRFASVHPDACVYCHAYGGYVASCQHKDDQDSLTSSCNVKFHPICAWFAGGYIHSEIVDPSFQGKDRDGQYPSGLKFSFLCAEHDGAVRQQQADVVRTEQIALRSKYRINELDLTVMPGKNSKRKNRRQNKKAQNDRSQANSGASRGAIAGAQVQKELAPDHYTDKLCAICMKPTTDDLFGSGYDSQIMSSIYLEHDPIPSGESGEGELSAEEKSSSLEIAEENGTEISAAKISSNAKSSVQATPVKESRESNAINLVSTPVVTNETTTASAGATLPSQQHQSQGVLSCHQCGIVVHSGCLQEFAPAAAAAASASVSTPGASATDEAKTATTAESTPWLCTLCATNSDVLTMDCALCPRHGGIFCPTIEQTMVHPYCARTMSTQVSVETHGDDLLDMKQFVKEANRKQKCGVCNRKKGLCLPCSEVGCTVYFHPLCGIRSGKGFVRCSTKHSPHHPGQITAIREAFCQDHIPPGIEMSSTGFWIDGYELGHMRRSMDRARIILDMVIKREKFKKLICKSEQDLFQHRWQKAFARATGKKLHINAVDERDHILQLGQHDDDDSDGSEYVFSDDDNDGLDEEIDAQFQLTHGEKFVLLSDFPQTGKKMEPVPFTHPKTGEVIHISPTWTKYGEIRRPKNMRIAFAGHQVFPRDIVGLNQKAFVKMQVEKVHRITDESRIYSGIFNSRKEEDNFGKKLGQEVYPLSQMSDKDFLEYMRTEASFIELPRVGVQRRSSVPAASTPAPSTATMKPSMLLTAKRSNSKKNASYGDDDMDVDEEEEEVVVVEKKKRGRKKKYVDEDEDDDEVEAVLVDTDDEESDRDRKAHKKGRFSLKQENTVSGNNSNSKRKLQQLAQDENHDDDDDAQQKLKKKKQHSQNEDAAAAAAENITMLKIPKKQDSYAQYQKLLAEIRDSSLFQEFIKHFPANVATAGTTSKQRRSTSNNKGASTSFIQLFETAMASATVNNLSSSSSSFSDMSQQIFTRTIVATHHDNSSPEFVMMERVLFHVLDNLGQLEDTHPETVAAQAEERAALALLSPASRKQQKQGKKQEKAKKQRERSVEELASVEDIDATADKVMLVEDYEDIPYEDLPQYDDYIRRAVSFNGIKARLQAHGYSSYAACIADFYTLMNNARHVATMANAKIRDNTKRLADFFERFVWEALQYDAAAAGSIGVPLRYDSKYGGQCLEVVPAAATNTTAAASAVCLLRCSQCTQEKEVRNWPEAFTVPSHLLVGGGTAAAGTGGRKSRRASSNNSELQSEHDPLASWYCPACVVDQGHALQGRQVQVWWRGDGCAYDGEIQVYEPRAQCHSVLYTVDQQWEFVNLGLEPYLFR